MTGVTDSRGNTTEYTYNETRGYVDYVTNAKDVTTDYTYNASELLTDVTVNDSSVSYTYDNAKRLSTITSPSGTVYTFTYDSFGTQVVSYSYDVWGKVLSTTGTLANTIGATNPIRYRGYYYDYETGFYYLQTRYYDPEIGRFINADILFEKTEIIGYNLIIYCGNNPIIYKDSEGYGKTYVIYYDNPKSGFYKQALYSPYYDSNDESVYMIGVTTSSEFIEAWNSMYGSIDKVYLYLHGGKGELYFKGEELTFSGEKNFYDLEPKEVNHSVYLYSCKGGAGKEGDNVAWMFAKLTDSTVVACTGSVSYTKFWGKFYARISKDFGIFKKFYYAKKYYLWGKVEAKSS